MHFVKKYFTEGLIQFAILLSLVGVRVDFDSYVNRYFPPLLESSLGPSSVYIQTRFHNLRDNLDGCSLQRKCSDLDYYFTSRRLLNEVKSLGTPRFPITEVHAWLVHTVARESDTDSSVVVVVNGEQNTNDNENSEGAHNHPRQESSQHDPQQSDQDHDTGAWVNPSGSELTKEDIELIDILWRQDAAVGAGREGFENCCLQRGDDHTAEDRGGKEEQNQDSETSQQPSDAEERESSAFDNEGASLEPQSFLGVDVEQRWQDFLSLSELLGIETENVQPIPNTTISEIGMDISEAISQNVSLHDAAQAFRTSNGVTRNEGSQNLLRLESTNSTHVDMLLSVTNLTSELFPLVENCTRNASNQNPLSGFLDEAVFDQINLMGLGIEGMDNMDTQILEEPDSDSGLSLNCSSSSPGSPSSSEVSSSSSCCDDEGAVGYSSDAESDSWDAVGGDEGNSTLCRSQNSKWSPMQTADHIYHNHTYNQPPSQNVLASPLQHSGCGKLKSVKRNSSEDIDLSRDERRARALRIPFSVMEIVNMPVDEFLELLSKYDLTEAQVTLIRDIRRRGKNKVAAQNCRKRKLDVISNLGNDVDELQMQKEKLLKERTQQNKSIGTMKQKLNELYRDVFSRLRDEHGRPVNPSQYSLQCNSDGSVLVVPRQLMTLQQKPDKKTKDKKH
ncbi:endoplasmic reticulum membrane sensor NFE2L1-like isoform X2 [Polyodon spathula]|uniref:endoplasmic reticulum membrane sensor NFE2L1-like isoform X2 n=1 Tax=Polyodon spathula TaxID=7913 RepID=UPI001B7E9D35|nr:endoplasmic reticulum membrane sensor NFE2L1-like isoform X2 [Polyodon spathula]